MTIYDKLQENLLKLKIFYHTLRKADITYDYYFTVTGCPIRLHNGTDRQNPLTYYQVS